MAEEQAKHRRGIEAKVIASDIAKSARGQWLGFTIAIVAIVGGITLLALDKSIEGYTAIGTAFTGLVGVFVFGRIMQARERHRKYED